METEVGNRQMNLFGRLRRNPETGEVGVALPSAAGFNKYLNPDDLVGSKGLAIYDQMVKDSQVQAALTIKYSSVLSRGWALHPPKEKPAGYDEVMGFCEYALDKLPGSLTDILEKVCDALAKGYSICEPVWMLERSGKYAGKWLWSDIKGRDPSLYEFKVDSYLNITGLRHVRENKDLPARRFITYTYRSKYENPYGVSDLRAAYRPWWCKDFLVRFWNLHLEKFGSPTVKGVFKRGTPKTAQDALLNIIKSIQQRSAFIIPEDMVVELLETIRQGDSGYQNAIEWHDKQISKAVLFQTLMTDEGSKVGSFALAKVHLDVLRMCLRSLKRQLEEKVVRDQMLKPLVAYNFGPEVPIPYFSLGPMEERDIEPVSRAVKNLVECGVIAADDPWIRDYIGIDGAGPAPKKVESNPSTSRANGGEVNVNVD